MSRRLLWFVGLWLAGVATVAHCLLGLAAIAYGIRWLIHP